MRDPKDDFDPNDVLKGWAARQTANVRAPVVDLKQVLDAVAPPGRPGPDSGDLTRALDGWAPGGNAPTAPAWQRSQGEVVDLAHVDVAPLAGASGPGPIGALAAAAARAGARTIDDLTFADTPVVVRRHVNPQLLAKWQPGAWTGAVRRVCDAMTEFVQTPQGPVIETYPPHVLLTLWPPQNLDAPLLARWPLRVMLSAAEAGRASDELLALMPQGALLWLTPADLDWALVGELVLHHDTSLRPFQLKALRAFVDAEREATFVRLNRAYERPGPGPAIGLRDEA